MIRLHTSKQTSGYRYRYAVALYSGMASPPRDGLVKNQYYVGQILDNGDFHVLKPERLCHVGEFLNFQLVSKRWSDLTVPQRTLLIEAYNLNKLPLRDLPADFPAEGWAAAASSLERAGYLRWTDEPDVVELSLVGEAELQHHLFNRSAGDDLLAKQGGIRLRHHSLSDHEIDLGRGSTLTVNVDGMQIRIYTMEDSGAVIRVEHDSAHHVVMNHADERNFAQTYVDRIGEEIGVPETGRKS